jgi:hypothetical protein
MNLKKSTEMGLYGPSTEMSRPSSVACDESCLYNFCVQLPSFFMMTLSLWGSKLLLEEIVNGCHWRRETLGTLMNIVLKGLQLNPTQDITLLTTIL